MRIEPESPRPLRPTSGPSRVAHRQDSMSLHKSSGSESVELNDLTALLTALAGLTEDRTEQLAAAAQRLAAGYYDDPDNFQALAQVLSEKLDWLVGLPLSAISPSSE